MKLRHKYEIVFLCLCFAATVCWAEKDVAPTVPNLSLPTEVESVESVEPTEFVSDKPSPKQVAVNKKGRQQQAGSNKVSAAKSKLIKQDLPKAADAASQNIPEQIKVEEAKPEQLASANATEPLAQATESTDFVPARETTDSSDKQDSKAPKVIYAPPTDRDPTLSPDDLLILQQREKDRLRAIEAEKQRKLEAERQRLAEIERLRQLELERLKDPSKEIRGRIHINGIIGQEVFIGNKVYTVGKSVLGAKIISVQPEEVVFLYEGQKFTKKVQLK